MYIYDPADAASIFSAVRGFNSEAVLTGQQIRYLNLFIQNARSRYCKNRFLCIRVQRRNYHTGNSVKTVIRYSAVQFQRTSDILPVPRPCYIYYRNCIININQSSVKTFYTGFVYHTEQ